MMSWREIVEFSEAFSSSDGDGGGDEPITYRVNGMLPVIVWDAEAGHRKIVPMRWGFPEAKDWRRPKWVHARAESIDQRVNFREPFLSGQRGIVVFKTFNEGEEVPTKTGGTKTRQWTIDPTDGQPRGFAFLWNRFAIPELPAPMLACVMVTVPANQLIRDKIMPGDEDPRMPAVLDKRDWPTWLGEIDATPEAAKAVLRTVEGVNWQTAPEPKAPKPRK